VGVPIGNLMKLIGGVALAGASVAMAQSQPTPPRKRRRKPGCTPCEAMAQVDRARANAGLK